MLKCANFCVKFTLQFEANLQTIDAILTSEKTHILICMLIIYQGTINYKLSLKHSKQVFTEKLGNK